tara:strand:- start:4539 stop:5744 length:1206 start_codon:yes stop_codon:yes gene_type:complete
MSYQRVAKPKAYVDMIQPLLENGTITGTDQIAGAGILTTASSIIQLFDNKPNNAVTIGGNGGTTAQTITIDTNISDNSFTDATCDLSAGDATITHDANSKIVAGLKVSGAGIPVGTTVISITNTTTFELSANVESGGSDTNITLTFSESTGTLLNETMFVAILGHNLKSADAKFQIQTDHASDFSTGQTPAMTDICNSAVTSEFSIPATDGWSLITYTQDFDNRYQRLVIDDVSTFDTDIKIGCILWGVVYEFPNAPDLNITKTFNYDGVSINESLGGQKYSHATHLKNSSWTSTQAWSSSNNKGFKSGRKKLDMSFSYLSESNAFPTDLYGFASTRKDESMVNRIIMMTNGGMYPLLLQLDGTDANEDDGFLWCRLDNEPSFNQVAYNQYSTQLSFVEEF